MGLLCILSWMCIAWLIILLWQLPFSFTRLDRHSDFFTMSVPTQPFLLKPSIIQLKNELILDFITQLEEYNITYWLTGYTLASVYLWHELAPWDDVMQIMIPFSEKKKLVGARKMLEHRGKYTLAAKNHFQGGYSFFFSSKGYPIIDIDFVEEKDNMIAVCTPLDETYECTFDDAHKTDIFNIPDIYPLATCTLLCGEREIQVKIPHLTNTYLDQQLGTNWKNMRPNTQISCFIKNRAVIGLLERLYAML